MNEVAEQTMIHVPATVQRRAGVPEVVPVDHNPMAMLARAVAQGWEPARIAQLMDLRDRHEATEARKAFNEAFAAFKSEVVIVIKNKSVTAGPLDGKKYAELFSVVNAVTPALSKHGLSASWKLTKDEKDWIEVTCTLKHAQGHSEAVSMGGPPDAGGAKSPIQARASTVSYLERYTLKAVCGVAEQGDDADGGASQPREEVAPDPEGKKALEACATMRTLTETWNGLSKPARSTLAATMNECRDRIKAADKQ